MGAYYKPLFNAQKVIYSEICYNGYNIKYRIKRNLNGIK